MVRELNMDTQRQNFWKESIDKEAAVRLAWHMRFSREFADFSSYQPAVLKTDQKVRIKEENIGNLKPPNFSKKKIKVPVYQTEKKIDPGLLVEMRPVSASTRNLLYKGFSALGEGRYAYLQQRKQKMPEHKYEFPITSGWEYGWKITDAMKSSNKPPNFGRTRIVKDSFYRSNGVLQNEQLSSSSFQ